MVNQDFDKFKKVQEEHKAKYVSGKYGSQTGEALNHNPENNQSEPEDSPGAEGRTLNLK
ncbi:hypothetical protein GJU40_04835 [Bacillus lacus]|uniref:Uncharacterized protein n=1 Tax=Metabacillus lacus TaxID=1983721 RepID=A0A7X2IXJ7_9BACI|nr:hypothetical protein [Metabacillus lacus]MRX71500.1 hypothetical protein [Metabacillus lacus]